MSEKSEAIQKRDSSPEAEHTRSERHYSPPVDIYETDESLVLLLEMPGVAKEDVDISLEKGVLSVFGRARRREIEGGFRAAAREFERGHYQRSFALGDEIDSEKIEATMSRGVLRLALPKSQGARLRRIEVKGN